MRTNKFSIGGLIEVRISSIVYWSYEDNFKPVFFFLFDEKILGAQKHVTPRSLCELEKLLTLLFSVSLFFFVSWFLLVTCFCAREIFLSKKKTNRLEIVLITSIYYTTIVMRQHFYFNRYMFAQSTAKSRFKFIVCWIV